MRGGGPPLSGKSAHYSGQVAIRLVGRDGGLATIDAVLGGLTAAQASRRSTFVRVVGEPFDIQLAALAAGMADSDALSLIDQLASAGLAAAGRTNSQIATELFLSARTVERHLTHIFSKLDVSSRAQLGAALEP